MFSIWNVFFFSLFFRNSQFFHFHWKCFRLYLSSIFFFRLMLECSNGMENNFSKIEIEIIGWNCVCFFLAIEQRALNSAQLLVFLLFFSLPSSTVISHSKHIHTNEHCSGPHILGALTFHFLTVRVAFQLRQL